MDAREQPAEAGFLSPPRRFPGLNSDHQIWQQVSLTIDLPCWPPLIIFYLPRMSLFFTSSNITHMLKVQPGSQTAWVQVLTLVCREAQLCDCTQVTE